MKDHRILFCLMALIFTLGIHEGKIALWTEDHPTPETFPYYADYLPEEDYKQLQNGIRIQTRQELIQILEDYLS